jgi:hypothetical protein
MFLATSTYAVLRGTTTDAWGDPKDLDNPVHSGIPGSVRLARSSVTTISDGRPQQIGFFVGRLPAGTDVQNEDRLQDERSGEVYIVDAVNLDAVSPILNSGMRLDLRLVR